MLFAFSSGNDKRLDLRSAHRAYVCIVAVCRVDSEDNEDICNARLIVRNGK